MQQSRTFTAVSFIVLSLLLLPLAACAAPKKAPPTITNTRGGLPSSGRVVIRSGLAWMDERSPLFIILRQNLIPLLEQRGLTVVDTSPSTLEAMPYTGIPSTVPQADLGSPARPDASAGNEAAAKARAVEMVKNGTMPKAKMGRYTMPARDADLPASVLSVVPKDPHAALFAISQQQGLPLMRRGGLIPGRLPRELFTSDPSIADYAIVARFAVVRPMAARSSRSAGVLVAAAGVGGLPSLGYGGSGSATWSAPGSSSYGSSPGDYGRGYEYGSPRDTWNRQYDFMARDYILRHSPPPAVATPPASQTPGTGIPADGLFLDGMEPPLAFRALPGSGTMGFALELDCYSLEALKKDKKPTRLWKSTVHQRADIPDLEKALPDMVRRALKK